MNSKILLSGVKPTGKPHIGNYFGAMKQFVDFQDEYQSQIFVADLHALTSVHDREKMMEDILEVTIDYLAIGLDPNKTLLYKQSDVPVHGELTWILNCLITVPYLMRSHAYKDAIANGKEASVGLFGYPVLMASDILLYDADMVPVGQDQKQHIEYARDLADKFNNTFGETFKLPESIILENVKTVPGIDGRKMSKSYNNDIYLFAEDKEIEEKVMKITTDSKGINEPKDSESCNIFAIHKLVSPPKVLEELKERYIKGDISYQESKKILIDSLKNFIAPLREKKKDIELNKYEVLKILKEGGEKAREKAERKMKIVRDKIGVSLY